MSEEKDYQEILPGVWLGNHLASEDSKFFKKNKIKAVLNTTKTLPNKFVSDKIEYMKIPVNDQLKQIDFDLMTEYLPFAVSYIRKHIIQKNNLLIHYHRHLKRAYEIPMKFLVLQQFLFSSVTSEKHQYNNDDCILILNNQMILQQR